MRRYYSDILVYTDTMNSSCTDAAQYSIRDNSMVGVGTRKCVSCGIILLIHSTRSTERPARFTSPLFIVWRAASIGNVEQVVSNSVQILCRRRPWGICSKAARGMR